MPLILNIPRAEKRHFGPAAPVIPFLLVSRAGTFVADTDTILQTEEVVGLLLEPVGVTRCRPIHPSEAALGRGVRQTYPVRLWI